MREKTISNLNGIGLIFRFITPIMVGVVGTLTVYLINGIDFKITRIETHFINHLMHHQDLEVGYERRITAIEGNRFTNKDGEVLRETIEKKFKESYPPRWLVEKVNSIEKKVIK